MARPLNWPLWASQWCARPRVAVFLLVTAGLLRAVLWNGQYPVNPLCFASVVGFLREKQQDTERCIDTLRYYSIRPFSYGRVGAHITRVLPVWLISLSTMSPRFIPVVKDVKLSFLL